MLNMLPMLIQLTEKDKRLLVALFIVFIIVFVLVAYIANGIKALMRRYGKGIDGYMYDLCKNGYVKTPKDFYKQVYKRESKTLFKKSRIAFRIGIVITTILLIYAFVFKPSPSNKPFEFFSVAMGNLLLDLDWPRGEFFGIKNFIIGWPHVAKWPSPVFNVESVITYISFIGYIYVFFVVFTSTLCFISRLLRARKKSKEVFSKDLDHLNVDPTTGETTTNLGEQDNGAK